MQDSKRVDIAALAALRKLLFQSVPQIIQLGIRKHETRDESLTGVAQLGHGISVSATGYLLDRSNESAMPSNPQGSIFPRLVVVPQSVEGQIEPSDHYPNEIRDRPKTCVPLQCRHG